MAVRTELALFKPGDRVLYTGEYVLADEQGNKQDFAIATLDEGETFPELSGQFSNLCYMLNATYQEEPYETIEQAQHQQ